MQRVPKERRPATEVRARHDSRPRCFGKQIGHQLCDLHERTKATEGVTGGTQVRIAGGMWVERAGETVTATAITGGMRLHTHGSNVNESGDGQWRFERWTYGEALGCQHKDGFRDYVRRACRSPASHVR
jgi:hypothetical protein